MAEIVDLMSYLSLHSSSIIMIVCARNGGTRYSLMPSRINL
jgi:hypothetical protein